MSQKNRPIILIFCDHYLPGYKSGGGPRPLVNTVDRLGDSFDFRIVTRDHDGKTSKTPYRNVKINDWNKIGKASVRYLSKEKIRVAEIGRLIDDMRPDSIYLNSFFSTFTVFIMLLRRFGRIKHYPVIVAPQGELSDGALGFKKRKKAGYLKLSRVLDLYRNIIWKTSSEFEAVEAMGKKGSGGTVLIAPDMPPRSILPDYRHDQKNVKTAGAARFVFLSRIHPKKNLLFLLEILGNLSGDVLLDVYGPVDTDRDHIEKCQKAADRLPSNVKVNFKGGIEHPAVPQTMFEYDFFVLPTIGENFGYVFLEALAAGCPLITSDRTPWTNLEEKRIGWDISLNECKRWSGIIQKCIDMDNEEYAALSANARAYAEEWLDAPDVEEATRKVLEYSLRSAMREKPQSADISNGLEHRGF